MTYDVVIIGAGLSGNSLACALRDVKVRCAMVEAKAPPAPGQPCYDERVIALSYGSRRIFEGLGLWQEIAAQAMPIRQIHVSDRGGFGFTRMYSRDLGLEALGYVVPARRIAEVTRIPSAVDLYAPARVEAVDTAADTATVTLSGGETLHARLVVVAAGGQSELSGTATVQSRDYQQTAVITTVTPGRAHQGVAYERFTDSGPLALLPMADNRCSLVWTVHSGEETALLAMTEAEFLHALQQAFGWRLGRLRRAGARQAYPLRLSRLRQPVQARRVFIGNAAHTLHPVAGQGFNLGLRDVAVLAQVLAEAVEAERDPGEAAVLENYARQRGRDLDLTVSLTDTLIQVFANRFPPLRVVRNLGLNGLDVCVPLKRLLMRQTTGLAHSHNRLARGLRLTSTM